jgi:hypothetical protein
MNPTTDDDEGNDITENTNMVDCQLVRGIKRRKSNDVFQNNNSSEPAVPTSNRYELLRNEVTKKEEPAPPYPYHPSPASRKRQRKENPVPSVITGPTGSWGI